MRIKAKLIGVLLTGILLGVFGLALFSAGEIYDYQDTVDGVHMPEIDAIVCLAGGRGRIAAAGDLWYHYFEVAQVPIRGLEKNPVPKRTPILYVSGMGQKSGWNAFAHQLRKGVLGVIQPENVVLETESQNTEENARFLVRYAQEHHWQRVLLVTSPYHMRRAKLIFERIFGLLEAPVGLETLSIYQELFEPVEWRTDLHSIRVTLSEYIKWLYYTRVWRPKQELKPN